MIWKYEVLAVQSMEASTGMSEESSVSNFLLKWAMSMQSPVPFWHITIDFSALMVHSLEGTPWTEKIASIFAG